MVLAGFGMVVAGVGTQTLLQTSVEETMRGRVLSLFGLIFRGGPAVGALVMGAASEVVGLQAPVAAGTIIGLIASDADLAPSRQDRGESGRAPPVLAGVTSAGIRRRAGADQVGPCCASARQTAPSAMVTAAWVGSITGTPSASWS